MGTALEMYASDNHGHYPEKLSTLVLDYLKWIPPCPCAGKDTYSVSYTSTTNPDAYTFYCSGNHHQKSGIPANYPQYNSYEGLEPGK